MAEIFRAVAVGAQGFERAVAIKRIREEIVELADMSQLFADEARVSALLEHPNIVQVYDFGAVDGMYYIAMEYLKGCNLEQVLSILRRRGERLAPSLAVMIAREVARGLAYAHGLTDELGMPLAIVHRDVSPANIMLSQVGAVKLLDFGIARITSKLRLAVTRGRALRGKCPYLAPEQITSEGEVDGRADIFALGAILWEMLTGRRLFVGSSDFEVLASVLNRDIPPPSSLVPGLPAQLDAIVLGALERDPALRYRSADTMAIALDEVMQLLPSRYGDLSALVSGLPLHPTEELQLPVSPPSVARFELVLPPTLTPGVLVESQDPTRVNMSAQNDETTRKVSAETLLAQLSRNPARRPTPPPATRRPLMLALTAGLLILLGGLTKLTQRIPSPEASQRPASAATPAPNVTRDRARLPRSRAQAQRRQPRVVSRDPPAPRRQPIAQRAR